MDSERELDICFDRDGSQPIDSTDAQAYAQHDAAGHECHYPISRKQDLLSSTRCTSIFGCDHSLLLIFTLLCILCALLAGIVYLFRRMRNESEWEGDDAEEQLKEEKKRGRRRGRTPLLEPIMESLGSGLRPDGVSRSRARSARAKKDDDIAGVH